MKSRTLAFTKNIVRRVFLRGPVLRAWIDRQNRRLDRAYLTEVIRLGASVETPILITPPLISSASALGRVLLIADCLWEIDQLVPEIQRIAPVSVLDLRPILAGHDADESPASLVAKAISQFIDDQASLELDAILFYARVSLLSDETFSLLRRRWKCPLLGMNLDDKVEFFSYGIFSAGNDNYGHWASYFDLNLTSSLTAADWYRKSGLPCRYIAMGFHPEPEWDRPPDRASYDHLLSFVGSRKPERELMVARLRDAGVALDLYGSGWPGTRRAKSPAEIYRRSQLNLGLGLATASGGIANLKARDFECPGTGACYLTTYNWELALHFDIGREILCYRSVEELIEMYFHYVARPEECLRIARAAHQRCAAEHTWEIRFRGVFRDLGFKV